MPNIRDFGYNTVSIEFTNRCNMGCSFCGLPIREAPLKDMNIDDVFRLLEKIAKYDGIDLVWTTLFGETLLYKDIWRCIDKCRELGLRSGIITNGLSLTEKNIDLLLNHPPNVLRISAQALTKEHHDATRGTPVAFDVYIKMVAKCLARLIDTTHNIDEIRTDVAINDGRFIGLRGIVKFIKEKTGAGEKGDPTIFDQNPKNLQPAIILFLKKIEQESNSFQFSAKHLMECLEKYYSTKSPKLWETAYELAPNNFITYKAFFNGRKLTQYYPINKGTCGSETIGILADGTVTCCCIDYQGFTGIGNIFSDDLIDILDRNKKILAGIHDTGELYFDTCKKCLGSPTKFGAFVKGAVNHLRFLTR